MINRHLIHLFTLFGILFAATSAATDMGSGPATASRNQV